jgi:hypothetical protein
MGEIEARDIHPGAHHAHEHRLLGGTRADRSDDLGAAH